MQWWDIYVRVPESLSEVASEFLHSLGSTAVVFHEQARIIPQRDPCIETLWQTSEWTVLQGALALDPMLPTHLAALQQWLSTWTPDVPGIQLYCRLLPEVDYLTQWHQFFQPLYIGERLMIRPPWDTSPVPSSMACLTLDPGPAFGTGMHPSTHMCLTMLVQLARRYQGSALLDIGCGSGILSLAALQLGWHNAVGVDIDAQAVAVATDNAALNGLQERVQFLHGSWQVVTGQFPCITANVYLGPLVEMLQPLTRYLAPEGTLILSGLLVSQEATMRASLHQAGLTVQARLVEEEWLTLAVRRTSAMDERPAHV